MTRSMRLWQLMRLLAAWLLLWVADVLDFGARTCMWLSRWCWRAGEWVSGFSKAEIG